MKQLSTWIVLVLFATSSGWIHAGGDLAAGAEKIKDKGCTTCHGSDGNSPSPSPQPIQPPILAGQHRDYLIQALEDYASGARQSPFMAGFAAILTDQDREDIALFYSKQQASLKTIKFDR